MAKLYIIAGEASGDLHGANLVKALKKQKSDLQIRGWGGDLMAHEGVEIVKHYRDLAFMGFMEVIMNLPTIMRNFSFCKSDILEWKPDAILFIDYPGFNLRMAKFCHKQGIATHYYISPQIWAWKQGRIKQIKAFVNHMYVILPFESDFYARFDYPVHFVGHPLLDAINQHNLLPAPAEFRAENGLDERPIIALLPGSRKQEISTILPIMLSVVAQFPNYQFVIAGAPSQQSEFYAPYTKGTGVKLIHGQTYALFSAAEAGLVTSGTATLEAALFGMPLVVCYKGGAISYQIARRLVKVKYISLVNLVMDKAIVEELIQQECNPETIAKSLTAILKDGNKRPTLIEDLENLKQTLGAHGASELTASLLLKTL